jgi:adenylosuccinate synthase
VSDSLGEELRLKGGEYGATTGRPRRCGWFDAVNVQHSIRINGYTGLALTKLDVLDDLDKIKVGVAYTHKDPAGKCSGRRKGTACRFTTVPQTVQVLEACQPVYKELDGWKTSTRGARSVKDLPKQARAYIDYLEDLLNVKMDLISTGQKRDEVIVVRDPMKGKKRSS